MLVSWQNNIVSEAWYKHVEHKISMVDSYCVILLTQEYCQEYLKIRGGQVECRLQTKLLLDAGGEQVASLPLSSRQAMGVWIRDWDFNLKGLIFSVWRSAWAVKPLIDFRQNCLLSSLNCLSETRFLLSIRELCYITVAYIKKYFQYSNISVSASFSFSPQTHDLILKSYSTWWPYINNFFFLHFTLWQSFSSWPKLTPINIPLRLPVGQQC